MSANAEVGQGTWETTAADAISPLIFTIDKLIQENLPAEKVYIQESLQPERVYQSKKFIILENLLSRKIYSPRNFTIRENSLSVEVYCPRKLPTKKFIVRGNLSLDKN